jgi:2-polyprenyl-3-methyl-5-hydroxy-6-metoxy-1,4-benzoquinol methylase
MSVTVRQLVPKTVRRAVKGGYLDARSRTRLRSIRRDLHHRYGPALIEDVDPHDEMFVFIRDSWKWPHHVEPMRAPSDALRTYLVSGDVMVRDLDRALRDQGRELDRLDSFLEFACGHGRFTRFLVTRLDPARVTVSDINADAVEFEQRTFRVSGFRSTEAAGDLAHDRQYEVVFVASLFSHLAVEHWSAWLARLHELVAPGGLLVCSTHGPHARDVIFGKRWDGQFEQKADGFWYLHTNETGGRLEDTYYGSAFVTEEYVRAQVARQGLGEVVAVYPATLWGSQDLYVIDKPADVTP